MKKILMFLIVVMVVSSMIAQETKFGITAGYNSLIATAKLEGISASESTSGFFVGAFVDIKASKKFHVQPELHYINASSNGESGNMLALPIMGKFYLSDKFNIHAGPQFDLILDESEGVKTFGIGLATGMGYDINENFFISGRYSLGLNNRLETEILAEEDVTFLAEEDVIFLDLDIKTMLNFLQFGIGYRF